MIAGSIDITATSLITHRDTFSLDKLSVISVRRPYLAGACLLALAGGGSILAFETLMYTHEIIAMSGLLVTALLLAANLGQLTVLSLDLKGTELSSAVWGHPTALNTARHQIVAARDASQEVNHG